MRQFKIPEKGPGMKAGFTKGEKRRLIFLVIATVLVVVALGSTLTKTRSTAPTGILEIPRDEEEFTESTFVPKVDAAQLNALVSDGRAEDRVVLEGDALDLVLETARVMTPGHFEVQNAAELNAAEIGRLLTKPDAERGAPMFARGRVDSLRTRRRSGTEEHIGRLTLDDGASAYFLALELPEGLLDGDYVRVDGLFLKVFSDESAPGSGEWVEGPLLVAPRAIDSYADSGRVTELETMHVLPIVDAQLSFDEETGTRIIKEPPFQSLWHVMAYARDLDEDSVNWEEAPELTATALHDLLDNGFSNRCLPYRIPLSRLQDARVRKAGENPARVDYYTTGWIGNNTWKNVIYFNAPFEARDVKLRDYVFARGFFLMNHAYPSKDRGMRIAPVFVLSSLERMPPPDLGAFKQIAWAVAIVTVSMIGLFTVLLRRDRKRSRALQEDLVRRRRARRARAGDDSVEPAST